MATVDGGPGPLELGDSHSAGTLQLMDGKEQEQQCEVEQGAGRHVSITSTAGSDDAASDGETQSSGGSTAISASGRSQSPSSAQALQQTEVDDFFREIRKAQEVFSEAAAHIGLGNLISDAQARASAAAATAASAPAAARGEFDFASDSEDCDNDTEAQKQPASQRGRLNLELFVEQLKSNEETISSIHGKDVILVVGPTGAGKSTLMQCLAGREVRRSSDGQDEVFEVESPIGGLDIGHGTKSCTRSIQHLAIQSGEAGQEIIYVDTPGFGDTVGPEADIATSLAILRIAQSCRSLRFVVLVNCASFFDSRGGGVRSLAGLIRSFTKDWNRQKYAFSFLFTHIRFLDSRGDLSLAELRGRLTDRVKELSKTTSEMSVKETLKWLAGCLQNDHRNFVDLFHPLDSDVGELRAALEKFEVFQTKQGTEICPAIGLAPGESCSKAIRCGLTEAASNKLVQEVRFISHNVDSSLGGSKFGDLVSPLDTLIFLFEQMKDIEGVKSAALDIAQKLGGRAEKLLDKASKTILLDNLGHELGQGVSAPAAAQALQDLASADALLHLPLLELLAANGKTFELEKDSAAKALRTLASRLQSASEALQASPLALGFQGPALVGLAGPSDGARSSGESSSDQTKPDSGSDSLAALPESVWQSLELLMAWGQGMKECGSTLPSLQHHMQQGLQLLPLYVKSLVNHLRVDDLDDKSDFRRRSQLKLSSLARLLQLGQKLRTSPLDFRNFVDFDEISSEAARAEAEVKESIGERIEEILEFLESMIQHLRAHPGRIAEEWRSGHWEAPLASLATSATNLLQLGASIEAERPVLEKLGAGLLDALQRGLLTVDQRIQGLLQQLIHEACSANADPTAGTTNSSRSNNINSNNSNNNNTNSKSSKNSIFSPTGASAVADVLQALVCALPAPGGCCFETQREMEAHLAKYIRDVDSLIATWNVRLETLWNQASQKSLASLDASQLEQMVDLLELLLKSSWRGKFQSFPNFSGTSPNTVAELRVKFTNHIKAVSKKVLQSLSEFLKSPLSPNAKTSLSENLSDRTNLQIFARAIPELADDLTELTQTSVNLLRDWTANQLQADPATALTPTSASACELEAVFRACEAVGSSQAFAAVLASARGKAQSQLKVLQRQVANISSQSGNFPAKKQVLDAYSTWRRDGLEHVCRGLPDWEKLLNDLQEEVRQTSEQIQEELLAQAKVEEAEAAIQAFKLALPLDAHLKGAAKQQLESLKHALEARRSCFDDDLLRQIRALDAEALSDRLHLLELSSSPDDRRSAKEIFRLVSSRVADELSQTWTDMSQPDKTAMHLERLRMAKLWLYPFRGQVPEIDVSPLKQQLEKTFLEMVQDLGRVQAPTKLTEIAQLQKKVVRYHNSSKLLLSESAHGEASRSLASCQQCLASVDRLAGDFIKSLSLHPAQRVASADLSTSLRQLKALASNSTQWWDPSLLRIQDSASSSPGVQKQWIVVGGYGKDGIEVRVSQHEGARIEAARLQHAAIVTEMGRCGHLLHYKLMKGRGPTSGWVAVTLGGKEVICPVAEIRRVCQGVDLHQEQPSSLQWVWRKLVGTVVERLSRQTLVRIEVDGDVVDFQKVSDHDGPESGRTDLRSKNCPNYEKVEVESRVQPDLSATITPPRVEQCYQQTVKKMTSALESLQNLREGEEEHPADVAKARCVYQYVLRELKNGLADHIQLGCEVEAELKKAEAAHTRRTARLEAALIPSIEELEKEWSALLEPWSRSSHVSQSPYFQNTHELEMKHLLKHIQTAVQVATYSIHRDPQCCGHHCRLAFRMKELLRGQKQFQPAASKELERLQSSMAKQSHATCRELIQSLSSTSSSFEQLLIRHLKLVKWVGPHFPAVRNHLPQLHRELANHLVTHIGQLQASIRTFDLPTVQATVRELRRIGEALPGAWALYSELLGSGGLARSDPAFQQVEELRAKHFAGRDSVSARDLAHGRHFAVLEISATASDSDVKAAFKSRSRDCHPDRYKSRGLPVDTSGTEQKLVAEARDALLKDNVRAAYQRALKQSFADELNELPGLMLEAIHKSLDGSDYQEARKVMTSSKKLTLLSDLVAPRLDAAGHIDRIHGLVKQHVEGLSGQIWTFWESRDLAEMRSVMKRLGQVEESFRDEPDVYSPHWRQRVRGQVTDSISTEAEKLCQLVNRVAGGDQDQIHTHSIAEALLALARIMGELPGFKDQTASRIEHILDRCQDDLGARFVFNLGMYLEQGKVCKKDEEGQVLADDKRSVQLLLKSFRHFQDILTMIFNSQTSATQKDVRAVVGEIEAFEISTEGEGSSADPSCAKAASEKLLEGFQVYSERYDELLGLWKAGQLQEHSLVQDVIQKTDQLQPCSVHNWTPDVKMQVPQLLADIAVYYTIVKSGKSFERLATASESRIGNGDGDDVEGTSTLDSILQRPHTIQVLALLRLFGCDSDETSVAQQLLQIRTGEGKSMVLGMSSLLFALLGFRVRCICYSQALSDRDEKLFEELFEAFGMDQRVTYSTIWQFKEHKAAEKGDIRQLTKDMMLGKLEPVNATGSREVCERVEERAEEEILLVDEVDMFFSTDFYGKTHRQGTAMKSNAATNLLKLVWKHRQLPYCDLEQMARSSPYFEQLKAMMRGHDWFFDRTLKEMCSAAWHFSPTRYHCDYASNRVGIKEYDGVNYNKCAFGYCFAYLHGAEQNHFKDAEAALARGLYIPISCGAYCYSNIEVNCILGVSGTLSALGKDELKIMRKYGVNRFSIMPSVYGPSNFKFLDQSDIDPVTVVKSRDEYFVQLTNLVKTLIGKRRAAIVVFETGAKLKEYQDSPYFRQVDADRINILVSEMEPNDKDLAIRKAATSRQITFTTTDFGRGMDFMCHDDRLLEAGGVHILQTFLSSDKSEEVQIQGRTARQGHRGSYSMLLCEEDLRDKIGLTATLAGQMGPRELYQHLHLERSKRRTQEFEKIEGTLAESERLEAATVKYFDALLRGDASAASELLQEYYKVIHS